MGAEALTRFASEDGTGPEYWFAEATAVGLSVELEIAALEIALERPNNCRPASTWH